MKPAVRVGVAVGGLVVVTAILYVAFWRTTPLHVVNGLPIPVVVSADGRSVRVATDAHEVLELRPGLVEVAATTEDGRAVETLVVHANPAMDAVVYSVLGAAPVIRADIEYAAVSTRTEPDFEYLGGASSAAVQDADYVFTEPPKELSVDSKSGYLIKRAVMLVPGGWQASWSFLRSKGRTEEALDLARRVAPWLPEPEMALYYTSAAAQDAYGRGATGVFLTPLLGTPDGDATIARLVMSDGCGADRCDAARELVSSAQLAPSEAIGVALRYLPEAEGRARLAELEAMPEGAPDRAEALAWQARVDGRWDDCLRFLAPLSGMDADLEVDVRATCLHGAGRSTEALEALQPIATGGGPMAQQAALLYGAIARASGAPVEAWLRDVWMAIGNEPGDASARLALWTGTIEEGGGAGDVPAFRSATAYARSVLAGTPPREVPSDASLPDSLLVLAAAEHFRQGDVSAGERTLASCGRFALGPEGTLAYVAEGIEPATFYRLDPELRAALELVRARRLEQLGDEAGARRLHEASRRHDPLRGWVSRVRDTWTAPGPDELVVYAPAPPVASRP